jgi:hypothetical protein
MKNEEVRVEKGREGRFAFIGKIYNGNQLGAQS